MKILTSLIAFSILLGGCSYTQRIRSGEVAFERKQYAVAADLLEIEFNKANDIEKKARIAYLLGETYSVLGKSTAAGKWYNIARANGYGEQSIFKLALSLKQQQEYEKAIAVLQELEKNTSDPLRVSSELFECKLGIEWLSEVHKNPYTVEPVSFNSAKLEYGAFPFSDHQILFSSDRSTLNGGEIYNWTGNAFSDLYMYNTISEEVEAIDLQINSSDNEGAACFSENREYIYFTRCTSREGDAFCKILESHRKGRNWSEPKILEFVRDGFNYGHPFLASPGNILFFAADLPDSYGGTDLYYSIYLNDEWGEPINLGPKINTLGDEKFPFYLDGILYFASDGHPGMGGLDIFKSEGSPARGWGNVINMEAPLNSGSDDFGYIIDPYFPENDSIAFSGFLTSSRINNNQDDIYRFNFRKIASQTDSIDNVPVIDSLRIMLFVDINQRYYPGGDPLNETAFIDLLPDAEIFIMLSGDTLISGSGGNKGKFSTMLQQDTNYLIKAQKEGYLSSSLLISTHIPDQERGSNVALRAELILDKIYTNKEVIIPNIFYDFDQWAIREDAKPSLDLIADMLKDNPDISIVLGSHTDCRGTEAYNEELSSKRAQSAVEYLIEKGISPLRLSFAGYGKSRLANDCACEECTEEQHQENRRTTFTIIDQ